MKNFIHYMLLIGITTGYHAGYSATKVEEEPVEKKVQEKSKEEDLHGGKLEIKKKFFKSDQMQYPYGKPDPENIGNDAALVIGCTPKEHYSHYNLGKEPIINEKGLLEEANDLGKHAFRGNKCKDTGNTQNLGKICPFVIPHQETYFCATGDVSIANSAKDGSQNIQDNDYPHFYGYFNAENFKEYQGKFSKVIVEFLGGGTINTENAKEWKENIKNVLKAKGIVVICAMESNKHLKNELLKENDFKLLLPDNGSIHKRNHDAYVLQLN